MAKKLILFFACFLFSTFLFSQKNSIGNKTHTYFSCIEAYQSLTKKYANITLENIGLTDAGYPLQLIKITKPNHSLNKVKILINNGIHPGEPEGIDASVYLAAALLGEKNTLFPNGLNEALLKVKSDLAFANNGAAQLDFVYQHSPYFEKSYLRYPIYRIENKSDCTWK